jgi:hypothetical protein
MGKFGAVVMVDGTLDVTGVLLEAFTGRTASTTQSVWSQLSITLSRDTYHRHR